MYFSIVSLSIIILFVFSLVTFFVILNRKKRKQNRINKRLYTIILALILVIFYISSSVERLVILNRYELFSEHLIEMILEFSANNNRYPNDITEIKQTRSYQYFKNNVLFTIRPEFGFISKNSNDTLKYTFYTNHYGKPLDNIVKFKYNYAFNPIFFEDIILCKSWAKKKSDQELLNELNN